MTDLQVAPAYFAPQLDGWVLSRHADVAATRELLTSTTLVDVLDPLDWIGGFAICAPATLPVVLRHA